MIGQTKLLERIDKLVEDNKFPRFSIVVGERGMEHEDVARYVANKMNCTLIELLDVKVDTIRDMIKQAYKFHAQTIFSIPHADDMSIGAKNALLKVVEEVPNKVYFIMCLEDLSHTLDTIQSRGTVFEMQPCTADDIADFARSLYVESVNEEEVKILQLICDSPGDVQKLMHSGVKNFYSYAEWVVANITNVNGAESFKIADKLALKDEDDKYDCRLFLRCLQTLLLKKAIEDEKSSVTKEQKVNNVIFRIRACKVISTYSNDLRIKGINKQMLIDNCILQIRKLWKDLNK